MTPTETLAILESTRSIVEETRNAMESLVGVNANRSARDMGAALTALLNSVAKQLDSK